MTAYSVSEWNFLKKKIIVKMKNNIYKKIYKKIKSFLSFHLVQLPLVEGLRRELFFSVFFG